MSGPAIVEMVDVNLFESWRILASAPGVEVYDGPDMLRFASGVNHPLCNGVMRVNLGAGEADKEIAGALQVFRDRGLPALCWVTPTTRPSGLASILEAVGLEKAEEATGMAVELSSLPEGVDSPESLEIEMVTDQHGLCSWMDVFCEVYELPGVAREFFSAAMSHAGLGAGSLFSHYVFGMDGSPVACSTTFRFGNVVGLYNVGTLSSARGKGIGKAASLIPLREAELAGGRKAVLHSTVMGMPVYRRLGFEKISTLKAYLLTP